MIVRIDLYGKHNLKKLSLILILFSADFSDRAFWSTKSFEHLAAN